MKTKYLLLFCLAVICLGAELSAQQHNFELYNNGAILHNTTTIAVRGDMHMIGGRLTNNDLVEVQGNLYSNTLFQQRGTGRVLLTNTAVNTGAPQFISGSFAVRGGQAAIGINDGSFYDLQLANDQGVVWLNGTGNIADVRNSVDFSGPGASVVNRIITHNPGALPANGSGYAAVFGIMNPTAGFGSLTDNTVTTSGNTSTVDEGYVQGRLRRAISSAGGQYPFVLGLEPAGATAQRGMQYVRLDFQANNYDVVTGYFETGSDNTVPGNPNECGYLMQYFGGIDHGEWVFDDLSGTGSGNYDVWVWPQDDNFPPHTVWFITKDDTLRGTMGQCGPSPVGLSRNAFNGFSEFGVAGSSVVFPVELIDLNAEAIQNKFIRVNWFTGDEKNSSHFEIERSEDGLNFSFMGQEVAAGNSSQALSYHFDDWKALPGIDYFYRLKMVDQDGAFEYTNAVSARLEPGNAYFDLSIWPNPISDTDLNLAIRVQEPQSAQIRMFDAIGKLVVDRPVELQAGQNLLSLSMMDISAGSYHLQVEGESFLVSRKLLKFRP